MQEHSPNLKTITFACWHGTQAVALCGIGEAGTEMEFYKLGFHDVSVRIAPALSVKPFFYYFSIELDIHK